MAMAIMVPHYTVDDLANFPDDGNRYELLDGVLLVTPAPNTAHQIIANRIQSRLTAAVQWTRAAYVVGPGVVVRLPNTGSSSPTFSCSRRPTGPTPTGARSTSIGSWSRC